MNKLFTILSTLVFITACGGSVSWDGEWSGVERPVWNNSIEINDGSIILSENDKIFDRCTFDVNESRPTLEDCSGPSGKDEITLMLEGDKLIVMIKSQNEFFTFSRKE